MDEKISIIKLSYCLGISYNKIVNYLDRNDYDAVKTIKTITECESRAIFPSDDDVKREIEKNEKLNIKMLTFKDAEYSYLLKNIEKSFPFVLHCKGNTKLLQAPKPLAIIGSRVISINNFEFTKKIAKELAEKGFTIVSGMAMGSDSAGHIGSLKQGTIAVLAGGVDNIYPAENRKLYYDIIDNGGLIVAESKTGTRAEQRFFLDRNRIIAGLSTAVVVTSAGKKSGTSKTVSYALQFNRDVMAFPGNPYDECHEGSNELLKEGAHLVTTSDDIIEYVQTFSLLGESYINEEKNIEKDKEGDDIVSIILSKLDYTPIGINVFRNNCLNDEKLKGIKDNFNAILTKLELEKKIIISSGQICLKLTY
jgi:DNA processing protein